MSEIIEVKLLDLKRQWATIREEVEREVQEVFDSQYFVLGPRVADFESQVADYCGVEHAVGVASGTDALLIALRACGIENGEEVITTPYTFFATAGAISATPTIGADGTIYVGSAEAAVYAITPQGQQKFRFATGGEVRSSPAIGPNGALYFGAGFGDLYAIGP